MSILGFMGIPVTRFDHVPGSEKSNGTFTSRWRKVLCTKVRYFRPDLLRFICILHECD